MQLMFIIKDTIITLHNAYPHQSLISMILALHISQLFQMLLHILCITGLENHHLNENHINPQQIKAVNITPEFRNYVNSRYIIHLSHYL